MTNNDNWEDYEEFQEQIDVNDAFEKKRIKSKKPKKNGFFEKLFHFFN